MGGGVPDPVENHKAKGFLTNTGSDPLKNHKATKPAFSDGGPLLVVIGPPSATSTKQKKKKKKKKKKKRKKKKTFSKLSWTPSDKKFWVEADASVKPYFQPKSLMKLEHFFQVVCVDAFKRINGCHYRNLMFFYFS